MKFRTIHKISSLCKDPVLRLWLCGKLMGKWQNTRPTIQPLDYLIDTNFDLDCDEIIDSYEVRDYYAPKNLKYYEFAGEKHLLHPQHYLRIREETFCDVESKLAFHRFAWVPNAEQGINPDWVVALWRLWIEKYFNSRSHLAWNSYTAAERLINVLKFSIQYGFPKPKTEIVQILLHHGKKIFENLEYFGENKTGNHLANNGRGLYLGGLLLGIKSWKTIGRKILVEEGNRIFARSGELQEGSTHYHLLVTKWYLECWLAAQAHSREEAQFLEPIVLSSLSVLPFFRMPAGLPLIGDVSPDCTPEFLACLLDNSTTGWFGTIKEEEQIKIQKAQNSIYIGEHKNWELDNWRRIDVGPWVGIWHANLEGWQPMPGHAHQDFGSFELHFKESSVFRDLGRRSYDTSGDQDIRAKSHNTLTIDGVVAYPENKAYYSDEFRRQVVPSVPTWGFNKNSVWVESNCFSRIKGVSSWRRRWTFTDTQATIFDSIGGIGRRNIERFLHTVNPTRICKNAAISGPFRVVSTSKPKLKSCQYWARYGKGEKATTIIFKDRVRLPWRSSITISLDGSV